MRALPDAVIDTNGNALSGVTVTYKKRGTATIVATFTTDSSGQYDFQSLPDGDYDVTFTGGLISGTQTREISILKNDEGSQTPIASSTLSNSYTTLRLTPASAITMTSTPTITAGQVNQTLTLVGTSDTNTVTIQSQNDLASSGLKLKNGQSFTLGLGDMIKLRWDNTNSLWEEQFRSDNYL